MKKSNLYDSIICIFLVILAIIVSYIFMSKSEEKTGSAETNKKVRFSKVRKERYFDLKTRNILNDKIGAT